MAARSNDGRGHGRLMRVTGVGRWVVGVALLLAIGAGVVVVRGAPPSWNSANDIVDTWLAAMAEPTGDRGWSRLSAEAQMMLYDGDPDAYWSDLEGIGWADVTWAPANGYVDDGVFYSGYVWLRSHPSTLPRFLIERGLASPHCVEGAPFGIDVQMRLGWFNPPRISVRLGKAGDADRCAIAFDESPGTPHAPFDVVGGAWATPGSIQRVGVLDVSGLVRAVGWGRENPPLNGDAQVTAFAHRKVAVTWRGAACDSNTSVLVEGTPAALRVTVQRGRSAGCSGTGVVYESILELDADVRIEKVDVDLVSGGGSEGRLEDHDRQAHPDENCEATM